MYTPHHVNSTSYSFFLSRHGQSVLNAGEKMQGKAQGRGDVPGNGLTEKGKEQVRGIHPALSASGIIITRVSSSRLLRAHETAKEFIDSHPHPRPPLAEAFVHNLEEVSQAGWELVYNRDELMQLRIDALAEETGQLLAEGLDPDLTGHVAWIATLGTNGESPLTAGLRGIKALEDYRVRPGELIVSHSMLNRYMNAIATRIKNTDRSRLHKIHDSTTNSTKKIAALHALRDIGLPSYDADHSDNKVANGGITEYIVDRDSGLWTIGRRVEPIKSPEIKAPSTL